MSKTTTHDSTPARATVALSGRTGRPALDDVGAHARHRLVADADRITSAIRMYADSLAVCAPRLPLGDLLNQREGLHELEQYLLVVDRRLSGAIEAARTALA